LRNGLVSSSGNCFVLTSQTQGFFSVVCAFGVPVAQPVANFLRLLQFVSLVMHRRAISRFMYPLGLVVMSLLFGSVACLP
jgi:hypothetical protein